MLVCGFVNAKNSFGGFTGMKPYYAVFWRDNRPTHIDIALGRCPA
jgi:hypothetical protein